MSVVSYISEETSPKNGTKSSLYKTELCKRFSEFGNCRYGGAMPLVCFVGCCLFLVTLAIED